MSSLIRDMSQKCVVAFLAFLLATVSVIAQPKSFVLSGKKYEIMVKVEKPFKAYGITKKYVEDIQNLPVYLKENIKTVSIEGVDSTYTIKRELYFSDEKYISDAVKHEAIHALDNATGATKGYEFSAVLNKDTYIVNDSYDEIFVTVMLFYLKDPVNVKNKMPNTYKYLQKIIKEAASH